MMDFSQAVPTDECAWLFDDENQLATPDDDVTINNVWKSIEDGVKSKIDEELTLFRSRIHDILTDQQTEMQSYMFGIPQNHDIVQHEDFQDCQPPVDVMSGCEMIEYGCRQYNPACTLHNQDVHDVHSTNRYDSCAPDMIDHSSSWHRHDDSEHEKDKCVMRILSATLKISNALKTTAAV